MSRTYGKNSELINQQALDRHGQPANTETDDILAAIDQNADQPLRLYATFPTADEFLNVGAQQVLNADGTGKSVTPITSNIPDSLAGKVSMITGAITGGLKLNDSITTLALPVTTPGQFRRMGLTLLADGNIQVIFSEAAASVGALANPGTVLVDSGNPIGWSDLEAWDNGGNTAFKTAASATNIIENKVGGVARIIRFGSGGGAGGSGNASSLETRFDTIHEASPYALATDSLFEQDAQTMVSSATASFQVANKAFAFSAIGQHVTSINLLDFTEFDEAKDVGEVDLVAFWKAGFIDPIGDYEVSRDGGTNWQTVTMEQIGNTDTFRGNHVFTDEVTQQNLDENAVGNADGFVLMTDAGAGVERSQTIVAAALEVLKSVTLYMTKTGTPTGKVWIKVIADDAGFPSTDLNDVMAISELVDIGDLVAGNIVVPFALNANLLAGTYHVVVQTDATYKGGYSAGVADIALRGDISSPAKPISKVFDGTTWSTHANLAMVYLYEGRVLDLQARITSGTADTKLSGFGILYDLDLGTLSGKKFIHSERFQGTSNPSSFTLPWLPDSDLLKVYDAFSGQAFTRGDAGMELQGQTVIFPENTFNVARAYHLIFQQVEGGGFDDSDANASLLSANHMGSTDPQVDKSVTGRGPLMRASNGTLVELSVNNDYDLEIYSVT